MCVETLRTGHVFTEMIDLMGHLPKFTLKMNVLPIYLLRNLINVCGNAQNRAPFFLRQLIVRGKCLGYSKNEHFPIYVLRNPINVC